MYGLTTMVVQYFAPLVVIAILYFLILRRVSSRMQLARNSRRTKTTKMLVAVVTVFAFCWTPFNLFSLVTELDKAAVKGRYYKLIDALLRVLAMSSSCINPFLYGWLNDNFRNAFFAIIKVQLPPPSASLLREGESLDIRKCVTPQMGD